MNRKVTSGFSIAEHLDKIRTEQRAHGYSLVRGACSELYACAWLLENGWEVFRNVSAKGWGDICAFKVGGVPVAFDVKTVSFSAHSGRLTYPRVTDKQEQAGILPIFVTTDGVCAFSMSELEVLYNGVSRSKRRTLAKASMEAAQRAGIAA